MDEPTCKICGHGGNDHQFAAPNPRCNRCPARTCQDGPDGRKHRGEQP